MMQSGLPSFSSSREASKPSNPTFAARFDPIRIVCSLKPYDLSRSNNGGVYASLLRRSWSLWSASSSWLLNFKFWPWIEVPSVSSDHGREGVEVRATSVPGSAGENDSSGLGKTLDLGKLDIEGKSEHHQRETRAFPYGKDVSRITKILRYYGLGLENGCYAVSMHFAEIGFPNRDSEKWAGLASRVFDIYIFSLIQKDFEVAKEAGGVERAFVKKFSVTVMENYLEIRLFWAGKGTSCVPKQGYYGPLIAAFHAASGLLPTFNQRQKSSTGLIIGVAISAVAVSLLLLFALFDI